MLFSELSTEALALSILVGCAVKHVTMFRIAHTSWFQKKIQGPTWWHATFAMSISGAALIFTIASRMLSWPKTIVLTLFDFMLNMTVGWFVYRIQLYDLAEMEKRRAIITLRSGFIVAYLSYAWQCF